MTADTNIVWTKIARRKPEGRVSRMKREEQEQAQLLADLHRRFLRIIQSDYFCDPVRIKEGISHWVDPKNPEKLWVKRFDPEPNWRQQHKETVVQRLHEAIGSSQPIHFESGLARQLLQAECEVAYFHPKGKCWRSWVPNETDAPTLRTLRFEQSSVIIGALFSPRLVEFCPETFSRFFETGKVSVEPHSAYSLARLLLHYTCLHKVFPRVDLTVIGAGWRKGLPGIAWGFPGQVNLFFDAQDRCYVIQAQRDTEPLIILCEDGRHWEIETEGRSIWVKGIDRSGEPQFFRHLTPEEEEVRNKECARKAKEAHEQDTLWHFLREMKQRELQSAEDTIEVLRRLLANPEKERLTDRSVEHLLWGLQYNQDRRCSRATLIIVLDLCDQLAKQMPGWHPSFQSITNWATFQLGQIEWEETRRNLKRS